MIDGWMGRFAAFVCGTALAPSCMAAHIYTHDPQTYRRSKMWIYDDLKEKIVIQITNIYTNIADAMADVWGGG